MTEAGVLLCTVVVLLSAVSCMGTVWLCTGPDSIVRPVMSGLVVGLGTGVACVISPVVGLCTGGILSALCCIAAVAVAAVRIVIRGVHHHRLATGGAS